MRDDRRHLPAGERDILSRQLVDSPGSRVQSMVESVFTAVTPVPALQCVGALSGQHLLVNRLTASTQTHSELKKRDSKKEMSEEWLGIHTSDRILQLHIPAQFIMKSYECILQTK